MLLLYTQSEISVIIERLPFWNPSIPDLFFNHEILGDRYPLNRELIEIDIRLHQNFTNN